MAEGGFKHEDFGIRLLGHGDDDDDDDQEGNTTRPFQPGTASTPYHGGEEIEMQTRKHEQTRLPETSYQETTPLLGVTDEDLNRRLVQLRRDSVTGLFDTTNITFRANPLSLEDQQAEIQKEISSKKGTPGRL